MLPFLRIFFLVFIYTNLYYGLSGLVKGESILRTRRWEGIGLLIALISNLPAADAGIMIHFDQSQYSVKEGESLNIGIILDADDQQPGDQILAEGLISMKFELSFDASIASISDIDQIVLPASLNDDGVGRGPDLEIGSGFAKVRGAIPLTVPLDQAYRGEDRGDGVVEMRLASIAMDTLATGSFTLSLSLLEDLLNENVFIDGASFSNVLDDSITFGTATVTVKVPEPSSLLSILALTCALSLKRKRPAVESMSLVSTRR